jgi:hypothetical protein
VQLAELVECPVPCVELVRAGDTDCGGFAPDGPRFVEALEDAEAREEGLAFAEPKPLGNDELDLEAPPTCANADLLAGEGGDPRLDLGAAEGLADRVQGLRDGSVLARTQRSLTTETTSRELAGRTPR